MTSHTKSIVANAGPDGGQSDVRQAHRACSEVGCGGPPNHRQDALAVGGMRARVMMELDDDPERDDKREVDTIKWLYEVLRDEAHNVRGYLTSRRLRHREPGLIKTAPDASRKPNGKASRRAVCDCSGNR